MGEVRSSGEIHSHPEILVERLSGGGGVPRYLGRQSKAVTAAGESVEKQTESVCEDGRCLGVGRLKATSLHRIVSYVVSWHVMKRGSMDAASSPPTLVVYLYSTIEYSYPYMDGMRAEDMLKLVSLPPRHARSSPIKLRK